MDKKTKILMASLELIAKKGLQDVPMSEIAKHANIATGTLYHHFKNKQDILNELYKIKRKEVADILISKLDPSYSYHDQVHNLWMALYIFYRKNPTTFQFLEHANRSSELPIHIKQGIEEYYTELIDFISKGQKEGVFHTMNTWITIELLLSNIASTTGLLIYYFIDITKEDLNEAIEASWRMMKK